jgi:hypothetical protein
VKLKDIWSRLTGISVSVVGVSWQPTESETVAARRVVAFLEDRRVLFAPDELEVPGHCVESVVMIRQQLTSEIGKLDPKSPLGQNLRAMRAACRKFLEDVDANRRERVILFANQHGHWASWKFYSALGELRGVFGVHLAVIVASFQLDIEGQLASILPAEVGESDS